MRGILGNVVKLCVLLAILFAIYRLWKFVPSLTAAVPDDDDIKVQPRVTVHVGTVTRATLCAYRALDAIVEPQPARGLTTSAQSLISSRVVGVAAEVFCKEGQHVEIGQPLFALDDRDAQSTIARDRAVLAGATAAQVATAAAVKAGNVPPGDALRAGLARTTAEADLSAAQSRADALAVTSPIAGTVVTLNVTAGQAVGPRVVSVGVVDLDRLTAVARVPGWVLPTLKPGQRVEVSTTDFDASTARTDATRVAHDGPLLAASRRDGRWGDPRAKTSSLWDAAKRGTRDVRRVSMTTAADDARPAATSPASQPTLVMVTVTAIDPTVDAATGLGQVDVDLPAGTGFVPGQSLRLRVVTAEHKDVLTVPTESVAEDAAGRPSISGVERNFRWGIRHAVTVGLRDAGRVEISGPGIHEGLDVVTTGAQALPDESLIEVVR